MPNPVATTSCFASLGEAFCWPARNYAAVYGDRFVDDVHLLLAAAEVSPSEMHHGPNLTTQSIAVALEMMNVRHRADYAAEGLPEKLTHGAQDLVIKVTSFAAHTGRAPTLRDVWVAISQSESATIRLVLDRLGIDRAQLDRQVSGA